MFVDDGGGRKRLMRLAGMLIALLSIGFIAIIGVALAVPNVATSVGLGDVVPYVVPGAAAVVAPETSAPPTPPPAQPKPTPKPQVVAERTNDAVRDNVEPTASAAPTVEPTATATVAPTATAAAQHADAAHPDRAHGRQLGWGAAGRRGQPAGHRRTDGLSGRGRSTIAISPSSPVSWWVSVHREPGRPSSKRRCPPPGDLRADQEVQPVDQVRREQRLDDARAAVDEDVARRRWP